VFGLDFLPWYMSGHCGGKFVPYTLYDGGLAVSSAGAVTSDFVWRGSQKKYIQLSTVATLPEYRGRGLSRWLMEKILSDKKDRCDCVYLYANDSVKNFYPKFGFAPAFEYRYTMQLAKKAGACRRLDMNLSCDVGLLLEKHRQSNPFSELTAEGSADLLMFHCIKFLPDCVYYLEDHDAVVIAEHDESRMFCYDVYGGNGRGLAALLGAAAAPGTKSATLGFTPKAACDFVIERAVEYDTTFFVLEGKENILDGNRVTFPFLSRA